MKDPGSDPKIVGGTPLVEGQSPGFSNLVAIASKGGTPFCSGTLIAEKAVMTAAHCLDSFESANEFQVLFGEGGNDPKKILVDVEDFHMFKPFGAKLFPIFDIAVIKLKDEAPAGYEPIPVLPSAKVLNNQLAARIAGYGKTSSDCEGKSDSCHGDRFELEARFDGYLDWGPYFSLLRVRTQEASGACNGDSGGPTYVQVDKIWYVVGVLNGNTGLHTPETYTGTWQDCESGQDLYTFAGDYLPWMEEKLGISLQAKNPALQRMPEEPLARVVQPREKTPTSLEQWLTYDNHEVAAWYPLIDLVDNALNGLGIDPFQVEPKELQDKILGQLQSMKSYTLGRTDLQKSFSDFSLTFEDLGPVAYLPNLNSLALANVAIKDFQSLSSMKLETLSLQSLSVPGFDWIPYEALKTLKLDNVRVAPSESTGELLWSKLQNLENLALLEGGSRLNRIPWDQLPKLQSLELSGDSWSLDDLPSQVLRLSINSKQLSSVAGIERLIQLKSLSMRAPLVRDLSPIGKLPNLTFLSLRNTNFKAVKSIGSRPLLNLFLEAEERDEIALGDLINQFGINLNTLSLERFIVRDVDQLNQLTKLRSLTLNEAGLDKIPSLESFPLLTSLNMNNNDISSILPLLSSPKLGSVSLNKNSISSLEGIDLLTNLFSLDIAGNKVTSIQPLVDLPLLISVDVSKNPLTSLPRIGSPHMDSFSAENTLVPTLACPIEKGVCKISRDLAAPDIYDLQLVEKNEGIEFMASLDATDFRHLDVFLRSEEGDEVRFSAQPLDEVKELLGISWDIPLKLQDSVKIKNGDYSLDRIYLADFVGNARTYNKGQFPLGIDGVKIRVRAGKIVTLGPSLTDIKVQKEVRPGESLEILIKTDSKPDTVQLALRKGEQTTELESYKVGELNADGYYPVLFDFYKLDDLRNGIYTIEQVRLGQYSSGGLTMSIYPVVEGFYEGTQVPLATLTVWALEMSQLFPLAPTFKSDEAIRWQFKMSLPHYEPKMFYIELAKKTDPDTTIILTYPQISKIDDSTYQVEDILPNYVLDLLKGEEPDIDLVVRKATFLVFDPLVIRTVEFAAEGLSEPEVKIHVIQ